jgi:hypothetical protein
MTRFAVFGMGLAAFGLVALMGCSNDSPVTCKSHQQTVCSQDVTYWYDDCGNKEEIAETCKCGCNDTYSACKSCGGPAPDGGSPDGAIVPDGGSLSDGVLAPDGCVPSCGAKECGDDGCGGDCGKCTNGEKCNAAFKCEGAVTANLLTIGCDVPYVLEASKVSDIAYMTSHFAHLMQQFCITGIVEGADLTNYPERMFYGQHDSGNTLSLVQTSMTALLAPAYSVRIDFIPDTGVTTGATWTVGIGGLTTNEALVAVIRYDGLAPCLWRTGTSGQIKFSKVKDVTLIEGGSYEATGAAMLSNPWDISGFCSETAPELPCCGN